jgi:hypothetical protein
MAKQIYINKHDIFCAEVHVIICQQIGAQLDNERLCEHVGELAVTSRETKVTVL